MSRERTPAPLSELEARASQLTRCKAWRELGEHARSARGTALRDLLDQPGRFTGYSRAAAGLRLDFSRQRLLDDTVPALLGLAVERNLGDWTAHLFGGADVNNTEHRPALHMALRYRGDGPFPAAGHDVMPAVRVELARVLALADRVSAGEYLGHGGRPITDVVNIGIGGSDLGAVMAVEALRPYGSSMVRVHFVSNVDGTQLADLLPNLEPERTLFIVCSKSFTTLETRLNADAARRWLLEHLPDKALGRHFAAVSVNDAALNRFGIAVDMRFRIWDWVGGRYSLWSSVGLAIALFLGPRNFENLLDGAYELDQHFRAAPLADSLPVILGLLAVWNQNFLAATSHAILPYSERLNRFPAFLQQLEMESNGKSVTRDGHAVQWHTGTLVWGAPGSNAQHAFFQQLHQGVMDFSADFIAPVRPAAGPADQHVAALGNMLAQAEALARGRTAGEALAQLVAGGMSRADAERLAPHKVHPGNHPSTIIIMEALDPATLGALVALYEHKVFVQSVIWGINPFDQWGVELGKTMAGATIAALRSGEGLGAQPAITAEIRERLGPGTAE